MAPGITISVDNRGLTVTDNGPGIPAEVVAGVVDFAVRVSSPEAYVSPCRGAQGNALKTVVAMPFVLDGESGRVTIIARGIRHEITLRVDRIRQQPVVEHVQHAEEIVQIGTSIIVHSASLLRVGGSQFVQNAEVGTNESASSRSGDRSQIVQNREVTPCPPASSLLGSKSRIVQMADDFTFVNPHVSLSLDWFGERLLDVSSTVPAWKKWKPSDPTSPHWYQLEHFARLVSAYLAHDDGEDRQRTVRELVSEFRGLATSAKQKAVLNATGR